GELVGVTSAELLLLPRLGQALEPVFADRLEHEQPAVTDGLDEAEVDEGRELAHLRLADRLGRLDREASGKDREPRQQAAALLVEQVVAPFDRRSESALTVRRVAR